MQIDSFLARWRGAAIAERFTGKRPWEKRLPQLLETLVALSRARMNDYRRYGASK
jgi:hypothetical protein